MRALFRASWAQILWALSKPHRASRPLQTSFPPEAARARQGDGELETVMVEGDPERLHVRSSLHGFVDFKKNYVKESEATLRESLR